MKKKIIDNNALSNLIKESITNEILLGKIQLGEKLVEAKYAEEFGTSRAPIREAFYLLTLEGFVQKIPRKGTVVKGYTVDEIRDLLEIRIFLEDLAMQKISELGSIDSYLNRMDQMITDMEKNQDNSQKYAKLNHDFHYQLILASKSDVLNNMYSRLGTPLLSLQTMSFMEDQNIQKSLSDHKQIIHLIKNGRTEEAKGLLLSHNKAVFPRIKKHFLRSSTRSLNNIEAKTTTQTNKKINKRR